MPTVNPNKALSLITIVVLSLILASCQMKKAVGEDEVILVVADQQVFNRYESQLNSIFNRPIFTPVEENHYNLIRVSFTEFIPKNIYKNIILLTDVDQVSPESDFINGMFTDDVKEGVRKGDYFYAFKKDLWARNQNIVILMDSKQNHLTGYLDQFKEKVFSELNNRNLQIIKDRLFERKLDKETAGRILKKYGVEVPVPDGYKLVDEGVKTEFFQLRREYPTDRWLTVIKGRYDAALTMQDNIIQLRDKASREYGDSIRINPEIISFDNDTTFDANGIITRGIWEYAEGGGPFVNYAFIRNNSLYLIDCAVFGPGLRLYPHLDQLEVIAKMVNVK